MKKHKPIQILDVGSGPGSVAAETFAGQLGEFHVTRLDANPDVKPDIVHDIKDPIEGEYDIVFCAHMIEHIWIEDVVQVLYNLRNALRDGGELWLQAPAMETVAHLWLKRDITALDIRVWNAMVYGQAEPPYQQHHSGHTLNSLRIMCENIGMVTRRAVHGDFRLAIEDRTIPATQLILITMRDVRNERFATYADNLADSDRLHELALQQSNSRS